MSPSESVISSNADESAAEPLGREQTGPSLPGAGTRPLRMPHAGAQHGNRWRRAIWICVCLEVGIFLLVVPWSPLWTGSLLLGYYPALRPLYLSAYVRGAISGLGLLNLWFGFKDLWDFRR
jgi:hypothetical protein